MYRYQISTFIVYPGLPHLGVMLRLLQKIVCLAMFLHNTFSFTGLLKEFSSKIEIM